MLSILGEYIFFNKIIHHNDTDIYINHTNSILLPYAGQTKLTTEDFINSKIQYNTIQYNTIQLYPKKILEMESSCYGLGTINSSLKSNLLEDISLEYQSQYLINHYTRYINKALFLFNDMKYRSKDSTDNPRVSFKKVDDKYIFLLQGGEKIEVDEQLIKDIKFMFHSVERNHQEIPNLLNKTLITTKYEDEKIVLSEEGKDIVSRLTGKDHGLSLDFVSTLLAIPHWKAAIPHWKAIDGPITMPTHFVEAQPSKNFIELLWYVNTNAEKIRITQKDDQNTLTFTTQKLQEQYNSIASYYKKILALIAFMRQNPIYILGDDHIYGGMNNIIYSHPLDIIAANWILDQISNRASPVPPQPIPQQLLAQGVDEIQQYIAKRTPGQIKDEIKHNYITNISISKKIITIPSLTHAVVLLDRMAIDSNDNVTIFNINDPTNRSGNITILKSDISNYTIEIESKECITLSKISNLLSFIEDIKDSKFIIKTNKSNDMNFDVMINNQTIEDKELKLIALLCSINNKTTIRQEGDKFVFEHILANPIYVSNNELLFIYTTMYENKIDIEQEFNNILHTCTVNNKVDVQNHNSWNTLAIRFKDPALLNTLIAFCCIKKQNDGLYFGNKKIDKSNLPDFMIIPDGGKCTQINKNIFKMLLSLIDGQFEIDDKTNQLISNNQEIFQQYSQLPQNYQNILYNLYILLFTTFDPNDDEFRDVSIDKNSTAYKIAEILYNKIEENKIA